ncbi:hypothetical protein ACHAXR_007229 [Thalassiosira sp. AJA248-18]
MSSPTTWFRQFQALFTKNRRLLLRRPIHLFVLIFSSVASVVFAWLGGRDARGPWGEFPPLNECGMVDPLYIIELNENENYEDRYNIPISLNEAWRGGLPVWLMTLGPMAAGISVFLILRDELQSRRWGTLKAADSSAQWLSWLSAFAILGAINSLAGGITAAAMPAIHAMSFGTVFGTLLFLNIALAAASVFLAALCGTCQSTALTVFLIMGIIVAGSTPAIATSTSSYYDAAGAALNTYNHISTGGGSFWLYGSTERTMVEYEYEDAYDEFGQYEYVKSAINLGQCEVPLVSYEQSRFYKTPNERDDVPKEDIFQGCYIIAGASSAHIGASSFFWFFIPQSHFFAAWTNILGYTSLPENTFSFAEASKSPEVLASESLANYKGGSEPVYDPYNTNGTSLFPQGSIIVPEQYYYWTPYNNYDSSVEQKSTCPSIEVSNLCSAYSFECYNPKLGYPKSAGNPSVNDNMGYLVLLVAIYSLLAAYVMAVLPMGNGSALKFYFPLQLRYWCSNRGSRNGKEQDGVVQSVNVSKSYGKVDALKPFSLTMKPGEVTALLGHNGAGKLYCCLIDMLGGQIQYSHH